MNKLNICRALPGLLIALLLFMLTSLTLAQDSPAEPYLVVGGFTTILAEPDLESDSLGRPNSPELSITGINADGTFYRVNFEGRDGWIHESAVLRIEGDLDEVPVVVSESDLPRGREAQSVLDNLQGYDQGWSSAIAELQDKGIIPSGGGLIFEEDYAFLSGRGNFFVALGRQRPETTSSWRVNYNIPLALRQSTNAADFTPVSKPTTRAMPSIFSKSP